MNNEITIEKMIRLLLYTADRLQVYIDAGIPVYNTNLNQTDLIVDEDYRVDSAEKRISDRKRNNDKDKELIKSIKRFAQRRRKLTKANSKKKTKKWLYLDKEKPALNSGFFNCLCLVCELGDSL